MYSLVYVSSAATTFTASDLGALLEKSRRNNSALNITGLLAYKDGNFMQLLEGDKEAVLRLFNVIEGDPRHKGTQVLLRSEEAERMFPDWSMAYRDLSNHDLATQPGFSSLLSATTSTREIFENPTRAQKLLLYFKESMR